MKPETYIISSWQQEVRQQKKQTQAQKQYRLEKLKEFRASVCDLFNMADFCYYAGEIGCNVEYLLKIAIYSDSEQYKKYMKPARNIDFRYQFWKDNGHSVTKTNPLFQ